MNRMEILKQARGFTIVELLIVVVVIAILAAITIVSYNGVTTRAKTSSAMTAAESVAKSVELYNAQNSTYPTASANLTGAGAVGAPYYLKGITFSGAMPSSAPADPNTITLTKCDNSGGATGGTGNQIVYWNYSTNTINALTQGSTGTGCTLAP